MQAGAHVGGVLVCDHRADDTTTQALPESLAPLPCVPLPPRADGDASWGALVAALPADLDEQVRLRARGVGLGLCEGHRSGGTRRGLVGSIAHG